MRSRWIFRALCLAAHSFGAVAHAHGASAAHQHPHPHRHSHEHHGVHSKDAGADGRSGQSGRPFNCGTDDRSADEVRRLALPRNHRDVLRSVYRTSNGAHRRRRLQGYAVETIDFPTMVFHVVHAGEEGRLSDAQLQQQFDHLNAAFSPYIHFSSWTRQDYDDPDVFLNGCVDDDMMNAFKAAHAIPSALNTYFLDCLRTNIFGYAVFPDAAPEDSTLHGTVNDYRTIDGDECNGGCQGDTLVHEWGHGFGLFHTFQSLTFDQCDCTWNDLVEDTPPEFEPHFGGFEDACSPRDTCSEPSGRLDPIENYMDYSDDVCLSQFTDGQFERMLYMLAITKPQMISASLNRADPTACITGAFYNETMSQCTPCPEGQYQDEPGQTSCKACPPDSASTDIIGSEDGLGTLRVDVKQCYRIVTSTCINHWIGDLYCDEANNKPECFYDGGDCCEDCCSSEIETFYFGYECGDGDYGHEEFQQCLDPTCGSSEAPGSSNPGLAEGPPGSDTCFNFLRTEVPSGEPTISKSPTMSMSPTFEPTRSAAPTPDRSSSPSVEQQRTTIEGGLACGACVRGSTDGPGMTSALGNPSAELLYYFRPVESGSHVFSTCNGFTSFDTYLRVYTIVQGSYDPLRSSVVLQDEIAFLDDSFCSWSQLLTILDVPLDPSQEYAVVVEGFFTYEGDFELCTMCPGMPTTSPTSSSSSSKEPDSARSLSADVFLVIALCAGAAIVVIVLVVIIVIVRREAPPQIPHVVGFAVEVAEVE